MHYYIDGYNLLFRTARAGDDLQTQRQYIIEELNTMLQVAEIDATVVFDAQYQPGESARSHYKHLMIQFTAIGETADELILDELKRTLKPRQETVVTSDKKLAWLARRLSAKTESVEEFMGWVNKRYKNKLRQQKEPLKRKGALANAAPVVKMPLKGQSSRLTKEISKHASAAECFDFYLERFQESFSKIEKENVKVKKADKKPLKPRIKKTKREADTRSDMERWQDVFERGGAKGEQDM